MYIRSRKEKCTLSWDGGAKDTPELTVAVTSCRAWGAFGRPSMAAGMTSLPTNHMGRALDGSFWRARRSFWRCSYQKAIGRGSPIHAGLRSFLVGGKIRFLLFDTIESTCNQVCGEICSKKLSEYIILPFESACPRVGKCSCAHERWSFPLSFDPTRVGSKCVRSRGGQMSRDFGISVCE
jgi:hypothetical protein